MIIGAGFGGLLHAVRQLQTCDFMLKDPLLLDTASGFGGIWDWNNYPGLMCDIESYIYMPLLEETGYMPSHKYVPGVEIKNHAYRIASMYGLARMANCTPGYFNLNKRHRPIGGCYELGDGSRGVAGGDMEGLEVLRLKKAVEA